MTRLVTISYLHAREDFDPFTDDPDSLCCEAELERDADADAVPVSCDRCGHRFTQCELEDIDMLFHEEAQRREAA